MPCPTLAFPPALRFVDQASGRFVVRRRQLTCRLVDTGKSFANARGVTPTRSVFDLCEEIFMADLANRYPENIFGPYYVDNQCIDYDLCRQTAPNNFPAPRRANVPRSSAIPLRTLTLMVESAHSGIKNRASQTVRRLQQLNFSHGGSSIQVLRSSRDNSGFVRNALQIRADLHRGNNCSHVRCDRLKANQTLSLS
jgi:hypothetical protein